MLLSALFATLATPWTVAIEPGAGLRIGANGLGIVRGSSFQYYKPDWTKGYYSSNWNAATQKVEKLPDGMRMTFKSTNGMAEGWNTVRVDGSDVIIDYSFSWNSDDPAKVEFGLYFWAPALLKGSVGNKAVTMPMTPVYKSANDTEERRLGPDSTTWTLGNPAFSIQSVASAPQTTFDARGYSQDFAEGRQMFWSGALGLEPRKGAPAKGSIRLRFTPGKLSDPELLQETLAGAPLASARYPDPALPLVPQPAKSTLSPTETTPLLTRGAREKLVWRSTVGTTGTFRSSVEQTYYKLLDRRFDASYSSKTLPATVALEVNSSLPTEGYRLDISKGRIMVVGGSPAGLRFGLLRLAMIARAENGQVVVPIGTIEDAPKSPWRGVHLFVGPTALDFQQKLWERVLQPLGMNKVVLQCEQTEWNTTPNVRGGIAMPRAKLADLFNWYRSIDVEPIPLVQSFGHMEWLFARGANRDLAFNKDVLYSVDPRVPRTKTLLETLWREVLDVTKAKVAHFGLDEVDMRGWPEDPKLVTDLWQNQMGFLGDLSSRLNVKPMVWGDICLAPSEAVDAANGHDPATAKTRRSAIPKGALIGDWHYRDDPRPEVFAKSLQVWKNEGYVPIASTWYREGNIRGFCLAAVKEGMGVLQTTWAGYESSEAAMRAAQHQFSAMILAADYSWSGRTESIKGLPYRADDLFRQLYDGVPSPLRPEPGVALLPPSRMAVGRPLRQMRIGSYGFMPEGVINLGSPLIEGAEKLPREVEYKMGGLAMRELVISANTLMPGEYGDPAGEVVIRSNGGESVFALKYGVHVRFAGDLGGLREGFREGEFCATVLKLPKQLKVESLTIRSVQPWLGLNVRALTVR
jgi:hypothetical protein